LCFFPQLVSHNIAEIEDLQLTSALSIDEDEEEEEAEEPQEPQRGKKLAKSILFLCLASPKLLQNFHLCNFKCYSPSQSLYEKQDITYAFFYISR
jgi:hypothetical protein